MRQKCVNRFRDIYVPKVRKSLCDIHNKTFVRKVQDMDVAKILHTIEYLSWKFLDCSESFQTVWKVSRQSGKIPDSPETFYTVWKLSTLSKKIPDYLKNFLDQLGTFHIVWKFSRLSGNFPGRVETFRTAWNFYECPETFHSVWKLSKLSKNFPDCLKTFQTVLRLFGNFPNLFTLQVSWC